MDRPAREVDTASACIPNIGRRGRLVRTIGAAVALAFGLLGAGRAAGDAGSAALVAPALLFFVAALLWFQAREKT